MEIVARIFDHIAYMGQIRDEIREDPALPEVFDLFFPQFADQFKFDIINLFLVDPVSPGSFPLNLPC